MATLAAAAPAHADLYVDDDANPANNACTQAAPCNTIGKATAVAVQGDRIQIGPGTYPEQVGFGGLRLIGAGPGDPARPPDPARDTSITGVSGSGTATAFSSTGGTLDGMRVSAFAGQDAVQLRSFDGRRSYELRSVVLVGGGGNTGPGGAAVNAQGFEPTGSVGLNMTGAHLSQDGPSTVGTARLVFAYANVADTTVIPPSGGTGLDMADSGSLDLDRVQVSGAAGGATALHVNAQRIVQTTVNVRRSRLTGERFGIDLSGSIAKLDLRDSLIESLSTSSTNPDASAVSLKATQPLSFAATGTTLVSRGPNANVGLRVQGASSASPATIGLTNSIVRAADPGDADIDASQNAVVTASHSSYSDVRADPSSSVTPPGSGTNVAGDPVFVNEAGGDYSLAAASPLVDRGDPAAVHLGELDLAGASRALDGNGDCTAEPDIGALERPAAPVCTRPPAPDTTAPSFTGGVKPTNRRFRVGPPTPARAAAAKRGTRFRYALTEPASMTFKVERRTVGRRLGPLCVRPTKSNRRRKRCTRWTSAGTFTAAGVAGANSTPWNGRVGRKALKPDVYRVRVVATDAAGNASSERRATFRIVRR